MIQYNDYDLEIYPLFEAIIQYLGEDTITDEDVWEEARGYISIPDFSKILLELSRDTIIDTLAQKLEEQGIDIGILNLTIYINGRDTYININGDEIYTLQEFIQAVNINGGQI